MRTLFVLAVSTLVATHSYAQSFYMQIAGAVIVANDGTFLGKISNEFNASSIFNEFGAYGSEFSQTSIFNEFSAFGSEFSMLSPFNEFSTTPPLLIKNNQVIGMVTVNVSLTGAVNPYALLTCK